MIKMMWEYVKRRKWYYLLIAVMIVLYDMTLLVPTQVIQRMIDYLSTETLTQRAFWFELVLLIGAAVVNYASAYIWNYKLSQGAVSFKFDTQESAFKKLVRMRTPFYEQFRSGDMLTRFSTDVESLEQMMGYGLMIVVYAGGMLAFILPAMFLISWQVGILALLPMLALTATSFFIGQKQEAVIDKNRDAVASLNNEVLEAVEGIRVARAYSKKAVQSSRFRKRTDALKRYTYLNQTLQALYNPMSIIFLGMSTILVVVVGSQFLAEGSLTLGQLLALQLYTLSLLEPFWMLSDFILIYKAGKISYQKIKELIDTDDLMEADGDLGPEAFEEWAMSGYSFTYPQAERESLSQIDWTLKRGQTVGIVGKTGAGKTTLVRQFLRQYPVGAGSFALNGEPVTRYQRKGIESLIGYVPQEHILFSKTVRENIAFGLPNATEEQILKAVDTAAFRQDLERLSDGLDTLIGERGVSISGGQKQRISIARAFLRQPEILVLDDSLSAVDAQTERQIIANIQEERAGKTTVIVTHRLSAVHHADWVLVLDEGQIVEEGRPVDLLVNQGWYYEQYQRQQSQEGGALCE